MAKRRPSSSAGRPSVPTTHITVNDLITVSVRPQPAVNNNNNPNRLHLIRIRTMIVRSAIKRSAVKSHIFRRSIGVYRSMQPISSCELELLQLHRWHHQVTVPATLTSALSVYGSNSRNGPNSNTSYCRVTTRTHMNHGGTAFLSMDDQQNALSSKPGPRQPLIGLGFDVSRATQNILRLLESSHGPHSSMYIDANAPSWHQESKRFVFGSGSESGSDSGCGEEQQWSVQSTIQLSDDRRDAFQRPTSVSTPSSIGTSSSYTSSALESIHWSDDRTCLVKLRATDGTCRYLSLLRLDFIPPPKDQIGGGSSTLPPQPGAPLPNDGWVIVREVVVPLQTGSVAGSGGVGGTEAVTGVLECLQSYFDIEHGGGQDDMSKAQSLFHPGASLLTVGTAEHEHTHDHNHHHHHHPHHYHHHHDDDGDEDLWSAPAGHFLEISLGTYLDGVASQAPHAEPSARSQDRICQIDIDDESGMVASAIVRVGNGAQTLVFEDHLLLGRSSASSSSSWQILSKTFSTQAWVKSSAGTSSKNHHSNPNPSGRRMFHSSSHQLYSPSSPSLFFSSIRSSSSSTSKPSLYNYLSNQIEKGNLHPDKAQQRIAKRLSRLEVALVGYNNSVLFERSKDDENEEEDMNSDENDSDSATETDNVKARERIVKKVTSAGTDENNEQPANPSTEPEKQKMQIPRGLYIYGPVGTGKSMLMDAFYNTVDIEPEERKQRYHFHNFLSLVHDRIHQLKQKDLETKGRSFSIDTSLSNNPIYKVGMELSSEMSLLCLDEFQVTDIADAVILSQLFSVLFQNGTVVVATSNRPPEDLYEGGLNRGYFLPFIDLLKRHCIVCPMKSDQDYRRIISSTLSSLEFDESQSSLSQLQSFFVTENDLDGGESVDDLIADLVEDLASSTDESAGSLSVMSTSEELSLGHNRRMTVDQVYRIPMHEKDDEKTREIALACLSFDELCDTDRGAMDYRVISKSFDVVVLRDVPVMDTEGHNRARRFITLIDELYESKCALLIQCVASTASHPVVIESPMDLFVTTDDDTDGTGTTNDTTKEGEETVAWVDVAQQGGVVVGALASVRELSFAFQRASSRIYEMTSKQWWDRRLKSLT